MRNLKRDEIRIIYNSDRVPKNMCYNPLQALKKELYNFVNTNEDASDDEVRIPEVEGTVIPVKAKLTIIDDLGEMITVL